MNNDPAVRGRFVSVRASAFRVDRIDDVRADEDDEDERGGCTSPDAATACSGADEATRADRNKEKVHHPSVFHRDLLLAHASSGVVASSFPSHGTTYGVSGSGMMTLRPCAFVTPR